MKLIFYLLYNKRRKEKNIMGKKRNEVNGVLVYRRWCAGAILSAIFLLLVIAVPVALICYKWMGFIVPNADVISSGQGTIQGTGLDLIKYVLKRETDLSKAVADIAGKTSFPYFGLIMKASFYGMLGFLALITIFGVIEVFMFIFYALTGRVVNPSAPVRLAWVIFAFTLVYAGLTFGLALLIAKAYSAAGGGSFVFLQFILGSIPIIGKHTDGVFLVDFWWPVIYAFIALFAAIILSIIYVAAFKDKFYIGRAKRFGSGEQQVVINQQAAASPVYYPAGGGTQIITTPAPQPTMMPSSQQPQVIVVNSTPANAPMMGQPQPVQPVVQVIGPSGQPQPVQPAVVPQPGQEPGEVPAQALTVLPADIKSVGGHAYSKNLDLKYADIPSGIKELGAGAFANCLNLEVVSIPKSVKRIRKNCFFNCTKLTRINYGGTKSEWRYIVRGANWLDRAGTRTVICADGAIIVDPHR